RRGKPVYYTDYSDEVTVEMTVSTSVSVTLQPDWSQIFSGEKITVRCEIQGGGDTEWDYEWKTPQSTSHQTHVNYWTLSVSESSSGNYMCRGRNRRDSYSSTHDAVTLRVSDNKPQSVLTVSPSWLSPGASVTLKCEVEHPSAGWRFYWYKTVPKLSDRLYRYELLPGSDSGTEEDSYMVHGQTHTAGYVCRAGRGEPVFYTEHSKPTFVWSGASLTVSPDRVQHFTSDSVSLSCEGNSTEWRVRRFPEDSYLSLCSDWGTMTGSTCNISGLNSSAVYWCESGSGQFTNSVNITGHNDDIILVSPVLPVTEGTSVTLGCKLRRENVVSNVFFYQNDKLIQNDTRVELIISAVLKSDQGFYRCEVKTDSWIRTLTSPQSWMAVKLTSTTENSSFPVSLVVGLVCGILLIFLLLLLCCCRKSKGEMFDFLYLMTVEIVDQRIIF
uniref:Ig-like domain-containing protein n=1 Tax=Anabas testudineus TaxID=64144 RepID=A0AAQ6IE48_ANATE